MDELPVELLQPLLLPLQEGKTSWSQLEALSGTKAPALARQLVQLGVFPDARAALAEDPPRPQPPLQLLSHQTVQSLVGQSPEVDIRWVTDSTNLQAMQSLVEGRASALACAAEYQTAGRGRQGRGWLGSPGRNILLSVGCRLPVEVLQQSGLSLAAGVEVCRALAELDCDSRCGLPVGLKWPNDLLLGEAKFGGILAESQLLAGSDEVALVVGVGINLHIPAWLQDELDRPVADLQDPPLPAIDRNSLMGVLVRRLYLMLTQWSGRGFESYRADFDRLHLWAGRRVQVQSPAGQPLVGVLEGVTEAGEAVLRTDRGESRVLRAGELSLRLHSAGGSRKIPDAGTAPGT